MFRILGEGQLSLTKFLLVTDTPQDLRDFRSLFEHILARVNWETVVTIEALEPATYENWAADIPAEARLGVL